MTRNVVRSKRMTSVALQASAKVVKCLVRMAAFGISVCTIRDQAYKYSISISTAHVVYASWN